MKIRFLKKAIEPKRFSYTPMYYDERKERIEKRRAHFENLENGSYPDSERLESFRSNLKDEWSRSDMRTTHNRSANIRVLILIGLILVLGYFIFNGVDEVDTVVNKLW
jgi:hypothetical protein